MHASQSAQTGDGGLDWLCDLAKAGKAINLGGDGYPNTFTGRPNT